MSKTFFVPIGGLRNKPGSRDAIDKTGTLDELVVQGSAVAADAPVRFLGQVEAMEAAEGVVVTGTVSAPWSAECRRCLGTATGVIEASVREIFEPDNVEGETYLLRGEGFDLEPLVRESVMLDLPEAPVCRPDCAGLCPTCGINRNEADCDCRAETVDLRWAALDVLRNAD